MERVQMGLSRLRGLFDRRSRRLLPKDSSGRYLSQSLDSGNVEMQLPRHIKVRISHSTRHRWVRRFSLHSLYSTRRPVQIAIEILGELLNTVWSLRRDLMVGSVVTLGMMLVLFNAIDRPEKPIPLPATPQAQWQPPPPLVMTGGDPYIRALMRTISASESNVEYPYSVLYGGRYVRDLKNHPDICVTIVVGPNKGNCTTAAGRYQMLTTTWDLKSERYHPQGLESGSGNSYSFEPQFQDEVVHAWLADEKAWGVDLTDLLRQGRVEDVLKVLSPTWTSLGYGIETNSMSPYLTEIYGEMLAEELPGNSNSNMTREQVESN